VARTASARPALCSGRAARRSAPELLEQCRLDVVGAHPARAGDEGLHLAAPDEATAAELDALELPGPGPRADRLGPEADVGGLEDLARLGQRDPVGRSGCHQSPEDDAGADDDELVDDSDEPDEPDEPDPDDEDEEDDDSLDELEVAASSFFVDGERLDAELARSFLAQPEPLKWIVGGANAFVIVPSAPQFGQNLGPPSWIPWTTSVR
jgi:hypothetical protein